MGPVSNLVVGDQPEIRNWLDRRRALGQDGFDEVWEGVYHLAPNARAEHGVVAAGVLVALEGRIRAAGLWGCGPFNLGEVDDFRVPDGGWFRTAPTGVYLPSAVMVLEVLSPQDETFHKFGFYHAHGVGEVLVADPSERTVACWVRASSEYLPALRSDVLNVSMAAVQAEVRWP